MANPFLVTSVKCAGPGCEHVRRDVNHWFTIDMNSAGRFICLPFVPEGIKEWEKPVCGAACAQKLFEQFLSK